MENGKVRQAKALLELLPSIEDAPILENLARYGLKRFQEEHAFDTPQDDEGLINHHEFNRITTELVTNTNYLWDGSSWNVHHLFYYKRWYNADQFNGDSIPYDFREMTTHKLFEPKQKHIFDHTVTRPPFVPKIDTMHRVVGEFNAANRIYDMLGFALRLPTKYDDVGRRRMNSVLDRIDHHIQLGAYPYIGDLLEDTSASRQAIEASLGIMRTHVATLVGRTASKNNALLVRLSTTHRR